MSSNPTPEQKALNNYIKYCLGYIKLTRQNSFASQNKRSVELGKEYFNLIDLLNGDTDGELGEKIDLDLFYSLDPKDVTEEDEKEYNKQKSLATQIEDIYNKYKNDQFTKQITLNFGFFEVELPVVKSVTSNEEDEENEEDNKEEESSMVVSRYPLFSLPIRIEKEKGKYVFYAIDPDVQINISPLESVLGEDLYYQLLKECNDDETLGKFSIPIEKESVFTDIWHKVKEHLKHKDCIFNEQSFSLDQVKVSLVPKSNYFLAEDLEALSKKDEETLDGTSLASWVNDRDLNTEASIPSEHELYFPFLYDKYKLKVLSLIANKVSIVEGPPGTGKSETIANLLSQFAATGKRVLFVSQKAQALKVVKDKLKSLNVAYMYGYVPNPASQQLSDEDENDGIAPQLAGLNAYLDKISQGREKDSSLAPAVEEKQKILNTFNDIILREREIYKLDQERKSLEEFYIELENKDSFQNNFTFEKRNYINETIAEITRISLSIEQYGEQSAKEKEYFDNEFASLNLEGADYSNNISHIIADIKKTGFDRHSKFFRKINTFTRGMRLSDVLSVLPREVFDYVKKVQSSDLSKQVQLIELEKLASYFQFYESIQLHASLVKVLEKELSFCGTSFDQFQKVNELMGGFSQAEMKAVKVNIIRAHDLNEKITKLKSKDINSINGDIHNAEKTRQKQVALYIQNLINLNLLSKFKTSIKVKQIVKTLSKAFNKSKRAFKTFDKLRSDPVNFKTVLDLVPVWIMELDDASRLIPLEANLFDYVILDEASQCNIAYTLPVMYRAGRCLYVGDSEQMRDSTIMFKSNKSFEELARKYNIPENLQIKSLGSSVQSVLDIAGLRGFNSIPLRYHYRSPRELIGFSNEYFYKPKGKELIPLNNNYLTYKDTNRVILVHEVTQNPEDEISDKVNVAEAREALRLFEELRKDPKTENKSIGILSFFNAQATFIREIFEEAGYKEEKDNYKVSIVEGIQGDEKDIIIYSFVIRDASQKRKYLPLTGEGGDIKGDINNGRVNVAFSRARLQAHCLISMPVKELPDGIWIKKYLKYAEEYGEVDFFSEEIKPFDSYFEEEFYALLKSKFKGCKIQNQVESCGFKIDFVITNPKTGEKLAIECDGPTHFEDEIAEEFGIYVESDVERQGILESAKWKFFRVKYSDWINNNENCKEECVNSIKALLN